MASNSSSAKYFYLFLRLATYLPGVLDDEDDFSRMTVEDEKKQLGESGIQYRICNTANPGPDMESKNYEETKADFEKEVTEDRVAIRREYHGVTKM